MFDKYIEENKDKIIDSLKNIISFKSISIEASNSQYPFGEECSKCLHYVLDLANSLGFRTKNIDEYCGFIEFGEGEELIGIIGHLDVVPASNDWKYNPFNATISDDKLFGRGAIDDKGPVIASLYAMKAVMDNCKINKRVRLILGLNEEKNWKCINYYKEHEEIPSYGFSPDANFPVIFAEKGILSYWFENDYSNTNNIIIKSVDCGNNPFNVVPKKCKVNLEVTNNLNIDKIINDINSINKLYNFNIDIEKIDNNTIQIISNGKSAHSAHPELGNNAISKLIIILNDLFEKYSCNNNIFKFFKEKINTEFNGTSLGINLEDESGSLTLNVAKFVLENNKIKIGINLRIPVTKSINEMEEVLKIKVKEYENVDSYTYAKINPLHLDSENNIIKILLNVYNKKTNSNIEPIAIGGATFARAFNNIVSFGPTMPGENDMCHQNDEFIKIDNLMLCAKIYADAIYELCNCKNFI